MKILLLLVALFTVVTEMHAAGTPSHRAITRRDLTFAGILNGCTTRMHEALESDTATTFGDGAQEALRDGLRFVARGEQPEAINSSRNSSKRSTTGAWRIASSEVSVSKRDQQAIANFFNLSAYATIYMQRYTRSESMSPEDWYTESINQILPTTESTTPQSAQSRYLLAFAISRFKGTDLDEASKATFLRAFDDAAHGISREFKRNIHSLLKLTRIAKFQYPTLQIKTRDDYENSLGTEKALTFSPDFLSTLEGNDTEEALRLLAQGHHPFVTGYIQWSKSSSNQTTHNGAITSNSSSSSQGARLSILLGNKQFTLTGDPRVIGQIHQRIGRRTCMRPIGALPNGAFMSISAGNTQPLGGSVVNTNPFQGFPFQDFLF